MPAMSAEPMDRRLLQATDWARNMLGHDELSFEPVSGDASFRRYFRVFDGQCSYVLMDAPPKQEDSRPFVEVAARLRAAGLRSPEIHHFDLELGFGLIEDMGNQLYRSVIDSRSALTLFPDLFDVLARMARDVSADDLPAYDHELLQTELDLFTDWYLAHHKQYTLGDAAKSCWRELCKTLIQNAVTQPQVFVHRDFHSCNLMWEESRAPGIIDFQDAVRGPLSYDFISLIWDRYIHWPRARVELWMKDMHSRLQPDFALSSWVRYCDLMGLQRNLKVAGIFARLHYRDGKQGYLEMIPRFYSYLLEVTALYPEFAEFRSVLEEESCAP